MEPITTLLTSWESLSLAGILILLTLFLWRHWQPHHSPSSNASPSLSSTSIPPEPEHLEAKPFLNHLEDLRHMLLQSAGALALGIFLCFIWTQELLAILLWPLVQTGTTPDSFLRVLGVIDPFLIQLQISIFGGFLLTLPFLLYFAALFILPALTYQEKYYLLPAFALGALLFLGGVLFCYWILLPVTLEFFLQYNVYLGVRAEWTLQNYLGFVVQMLVAFGLSFELPLVILILNFLGIISHSLLVEYRRHSIVAIVIFAACITPTSDLFSLSLLSVPMYLLYESCIWITLWREKWQEKKEQEQQALYQREWQEQQQQRQTRSTPPSKENPNDPPEKH